ACTSVPLVGSRLHLRALRRRHRQLACHAAPSLHVAWRQPGAIMSATAPRFTPGSLVRTRGRDWIVQPGSVAPQLYLRPLSGGKDDSSLIHAELEGDVTSAHFPLPEPKQEGSQDEAALLADALRMALRHGAGPFRSFGNIAVEPRTYQLVPLLMAMRLDPVRLLLADDVGIGKTIEAGLIAREMHDRGEIE